MAFILIYIGIVVFFLSLFRAAASADRIWEQGRDAAVPSGVELGQLDGGLVGEGCEDLQGSPHCLYVLAERR